jgi:cystathionine gamma-synthase
MGPGVLRINCRQRGGLDVSTRITRRPRAPETQAVHGPHAEQRGPVSTPIVHSVTFSFDSLDGMLDEKARGAAGSFYQRCGHPTIHAVEERLAGLEGSESALLFPSGMAAIACAFFAMLRPGDHVVCTHPCYGGTQTLLQWGAERFGWSYTLVDARRPPAEWASAFTPATRVLHLETPVNPTLVMFDIASAAALGKQHGCTVTLDNTVATPLGQRPLELGCDLSLYSATKTIAGHSDLLAGAAMGPNAVIDPIRQAREVFGPIAEPAMAWMLERSLKTLPLRMHAANANALALATRLQAHPNVAQVFYPGLPSHPGHAIAAKQMHDGFGPLLSIDVRGGAEAALRVANALKLVLHGTSLGGIESLASLAAYTSHQGLGPEGRARAGIPEGLLRISVGVENADDLWSDLEQALEAAPGR